MRNLKELSNPHCLSTEIFQTELKIFQAIKDNKKSVQVGMVKRNTSGKTNDQLIEEELLNTGYKLFYEKSPFCDSYLEPTEIYYVYVDLCDCK